MRWHAAHADILAGLLVQSVEIMRISHLILAAAAVARFRLEVVLHNTVRLAHQQRTLIGRHRHIMLPLHHSDGAGAWLLDCSAQRLRRHADSAPFRPCHVVVGDCWPLSDRQSLHRVVMVPSVVLGGKILTVVWFEFGLAELPHPGPICRDRTGARV